MFVQADFTVASECDGKMVLANYLCGTLDTIDSGLIDDQYSISVGMLDRHQLILKNGDICKRGIMSSANR